MLYFQQNIFLQMCEQSSVMKTITTSKSYFIFPTSVLKSTSKQNKEILLPCKRVSLLKYMMPMEHATYVHVDLLSFSYTPSNNGNNQMLLHSSSHSWHLQGNYSDSSCNGVNMEFRALPQKVIHVVKLIQKKHCCPDFFPPLLS